MKITVLLLIQPATVLNQSQAAADGNTHEKENSKKSELNLKIEMLKVNAKNSDLLVKLKVSYNLNALEEASILTSK